MPKDQSGVNMIKFKHLKLFKRRACLMTKYQKNPPPRNFLKTLSKHQEGLLSWSASVLWFTGMKKSVCPEMIDEASRIWTCCIIIHFQCCQMTFLCNKATLLVIARWANLTILYNNKDSQLLCEWHRMIRPQSYEKKNVFQIDVVFSACCDKKSERNKKT